jgi:hypothetical protein
MIVYVQRGLHREPRENSQMAIFSKRQRQELSAPSHPAASHPWPTYVREADPPIVEAFKDLRFARHLQDGHVRAVSRCYADRLERDGWDQLMRLLIERQLPQQWPCIF